MSSRRITGMNWVLEPGKFLSLQEAKRLFETVRERAETAVYRRQKVSIKDYFIIDLALSTGLRVMEIANLNCGDVFIQDDTSSLLVGMARVVKKDSYDSTDLSNAILLSTFNGSNPWVNPPGQVTHCYYPVIRVVTCPREHYRKLSNEQQPEQDCLLISLFTV